MGSRDFYLNPETLSNLFLTELEKQGYWPLKGWRSNRQDVLVQKVDGRVVSVNVDASNHVVISEVELTPTSWATPD